MLTELFSVVDGCNIYRRKGYIIGRKSRTLSVPAVWVQDFVINLRCPYGKIQGSLIVSLLFIQGALSVHKSVFLFSFLPSSMFATKPVFLSDQKLINSVAFILPTGVLLLEMW